MFMSTITVYSAAAAAPIQAFSLLSVLAENRATWEIATEDTVGDDPKPQQQSRKTASVDFSCYTP